MLLKPRTYNYKCPCPRSRRSKLVVCGSASPQQVDGVALLTSRAYTPPRYVGAVAVSDLPGKGLGLVATANLSAGELLVCCQPLAVALGAPGKPPSNEDLVYRLQALQVDPWVGPWLRLLLHTQQQANPAGTWQQEQSDRQIAAGQPASVDGVQATVPPPAPVAAAAAAAAAAAGAVQQQRVLQAQQLMAAGPVSTGMLAADAADPSAAAVQSWPAESSSNGNGRPAKAPLSTSQLQQVVAACAYSDVCEDTGAAALKELTPESVTGLWPEFSLFNHSCAPNAVAVVVGQSLLVRAVTPVLTGEELTISYLGVDRLAPVAHRRAVLQGRYRFVCQCSRCLLEQSTFPTRYYTVDDSVLGPQPLEPPPAPHAAAAAVAASDSSLGAGGEPAGGGGTSTGSGSIAAPDEKAGPGPSSSQQQQQQQVQRQQGRFGWVWSAADAALQWVGLPPRFTAVGRPLQPSPQYQLLQQMYQEATTSLAVEVRDVVTSDTRVTQRRLAALQQVCLRVAAVSGAIADLEPWQLQPPAAAVQWLQASIFPLLQLQLQLLEVLTSAGGLPTPEQLEAAARARRNSSSRGSGSRWAAWVQRKEPLLPGLDLSSRAAAVGSLCEVVGRQAEVVAAVARGSELHLELAVRHLELVRQVYGPDAVATRTAEAFCSAAHVARYGTLPSTTLLALIAARRRQLLAASLARRMSVIAWDDESAASTAAGAPGG